MTGKARAALVGLALVTGGNVGAPAAEPDWTKAIVVTVVTIEYKFVPSHLAFHHGTAYRLHVENPGKELHEFTAPDFFKAVTLRDPGVLNADRTEIVVRPGEQKDLYFITGAPGHFALTCADHDWAGMTGDITIE